MSIKNIFFDLDYTLWDFKRNSEDALCEIIEQMKLKELYNIEKEDFLNNYKEINYKLWALYEKGELEKDVLRWARFSHTLESFGVKNRELGEIIGDKYIELSPKKTRLFDGALNVLEILSAKYNLFIITNGFAEIQYDKIKNSGIKPYIKALISSEEAGAQKPSKQIFDYALKRYNLQANECSIIGDDFTADILGGLNAGFTSTFWFNPEDKTSDYFREGIVEIKNLNEILKYF